RIPPPPRVSVFPTKQSLCRIHHPQPAPRKRYFSCSTRLRSPPSIGTRPSASNYHRNKHPTLIPTEVAAAFFPHPVPRDAPPRSGGTPQLPSFFYCSPCE